MSGASHAMNHTIGAIKTGGDVIAAGLTVGVLAAILPPIAALLTIVWTGIRIWETKTVGRLIGREE